MRSAGGRAAVAASALALLLPLAGSAALVPSGPCARPVVTPFGPLGCPTEGGWHFQAGDRWLFTHGGDTLPSDGTGAITRAKPNKPPCVGDPRSEFHIQMIYAHAADRPDDYGDRSDLITDMIEIANGVVVEEAGRFDRIVEIPVSCKNGSAWIRNVTLPTRWKQTHAGTVFRDLLDAGFDSPFAKYWVWFDGHPPNVAELGIANSYPIGRPNTPAHPANLGGAIAITWGGTGSGGINTMLHEGGHTLGAVSLTATNTTGGGHCIDGPDVMCYADGGPRASKYRGNVCPEAHFDCNNDDYFHPKPPKKNYLYSNWNIASPMNRFIHGCSFRTGVLTVPGAGLDPEDVTNPVLAEAGSSTSLIAAQRSVPKTCRGRSFAVSGVPVNPGGTLIDDDDGSVSELYRYLLPDELQQTDLDVCWYDGAELLRCDSTGWFESGTVPKDATRVRVILRSGSSAIYTLNIV